MWNSSCVSSCLNSFSQSLPLPTPEQRLFQTFCSECKSCLFQMGSLSLEQTSALPQTWACFCLPRMPESAWQGRVCLQSGTVPWLPGETCSPSGHLPTAGCAQLSLCDARCRRLAALLQSLLKFLVSSYVSQCPRYWWAQDETLLTFGNASEWVRGWLSGL